MASRPPQKARRRHGSHQSKGFSTMRKNNDGLRPSSADLQNSASVEYFAASHAHYSSMVTLAMGLSMAVILLGVVVLFIQKDTIGRVILEIPLNLILKAVNHSQTVVMIL